MILIIAYTFAIREANIPTEHYVSVEYIFSLMSFCRSTVSIHRRERAGPFWPHDNSILSLWYTLVMSLHSLALGQDSFYLQCTQHRELDYRTAWRKQLCGVWTVGSNTDWFFNFILIAWNKQARHYLPKAPMSLTSPNFMWYNTAHEPHEINDYHHWQQRLQSLSPTDLWKFYNIVL